MNLVRKTKNCFLLTVLVLLVLTVAGCNKNTTGTWQAGKPLAREKVKIGVIYVTDPGETSGYTRAHAAGIGAMRRELGLADDQITERGNVYDADSDLAESAMRDCIAGGANIIIATSWGYMDACEKLAREFPRVVFAHATGYKQNDTNFTNYFGRVYQARYLSGIVAGLKTRAGRIGYVAAQGMDNSEVTGGLNAFALGVEKVNPGARIYVRFTYSWFDPMGETDAARSLIAGGCDVIGQHCDSAFPQIEAEKAGVWGIGYNSDMSGEAPGAVLCSVVWNWGVYYTRLVQSVIDGSFTTTPYFGGIDDGMVDITPIAAGLAAPGTAGAVDTEKLRIMNGGFNVFDGVLETNDGRTIGAGGTTLPDSEITGGINWYYRNVVER
jgi:basic membrane protein A